MTQRTSSDSGAPFAPALLLSLQAAEWLGVKPQTLRKWRLKGTGPRYVRLGVGGPARVAYRVADLEAWIAARSFTSTADETVARSVSP